MMTTRTLTMLCGAGLVLWWLLILAAVTFA